MEKVCCVTYLQFLLLATFCVCICFANCWFCGGRFVAAVLLLHLCFGVRIIHVFAACLHLLAIVVFLFLSIKLTNRLPKVFPRVLVNANRNAQFNLFISAAENGC